MTKNVLLKVALAAALAAPVVYGLSSSAPEAPPEMGQGPRAEGPRGERGPRRFRQGAPEASEGRGERPAFAAEEGREARGPRDGRGPREGRGFRGERGPREERGEHRGEGRRERAGRFAEHLKDELSLTAEQAEQVQAVFAQFRGQRGALRELSPEERQAARETRRAQIDAQLAEILTPEQQTRMAELRAERQARFEANGRRGRGRGEDTRYVNGVDTRGI